MTDFQALLEQLEPIVRQREARTRAIREERDRRLARVAWFNDMERLHNRIRAGASTAFIKAVNDIETMATETVAQARRDRREQQAAKLKSILDRLDAAIAARSITAEDVAKIEVRINRLSERIVTP